MADDIIANPEIIDRSRLELICDGDEAIMAVLLDAFHDDAQRAIDMIVQMHAKSDYGGVRYQAHGLKGAAGNVGAPMLQRLASKIETCCDSGFVEALPALLITLQTAFGQFKGVIQQ